MQLAKDISKRGFRSWYERQLIESLVYLTTCIVCAFGVAAFVEACLSSAGAARGLFMLLAAFVSGIIAIHAWQRFSAMIVRAQRLADKATCAECGVYGILRVTDASRIAHPAYDDRGISDADDKDAQWLRVQCKKCGHEWVI